MKCSRFFLLALLPSLCLAGGHHPSPPTPSGTNNESNAYSDSAAYSGSNSAAQSSAVVSSTSQASQTQTAVGGSQSQTNKATGGEANNAGNTQGVEINETHPRSAPSLGQGSTYIGACGAGGNAGGSGPNGAGFLGITWTPADCKLLLAAEAYRSVGMPDAACSMINRISAVQKAWKDIGEAPPPCVTKVEAVAIHAEPDLSVYVTKQELAEHEKRIVTTVTSK